jgi:hypothetical protein
MELIVQDKKVFIKKVGDLVRHKRNNDKRKTGIVLEIRNERIGVAHVDGTFGWAYHWHYWKIVK